MFFGEYDREMDIRVQRAEAMQQGSHNRNIEIAKQMLLKNFSQEDICSITSLSLTEIKALQNDIN